MNPRNFLIALGCLLLVLGCDHTRWNIFRGPDPPPATKVPSADQLVAYLNDNAGRIQTLSSDNLSMTCSQGLQSIGLNSGKIRLEKPRNLRLVADLAGKRALDLGSNDQEFWFWISELKPPYQFYCSHKALQEGKVKSMPFPFQPDWVVEAIGLGPYGPAEKYERQYDNQTVKLIEKTRSPQGQAVRKVLVFSRRPVQPPTPQLMSCHLVDDASGKEICSATILETKLAGKDNGIVPHRLELRWPENNLKMVMVLSGMTANDALVPAAFQRPRDVPAFDLATRRLDAQPQGLQRLHSMP